MMRTRRILVIIGLLVAVSAFTSIGWAVPYLINYQGKLTDKDGNPMNGTVKIRFNLYDSEIGGTGLWFEEQYVNVVDGVYNVLLGSESDLSPDMFSSDELYLAIDIYNSDTSSWKTLSPRQRITSTAFAIKAGDAETLGGFDINYFDETYVNANEENSITSRMIADGAVTGADVKDFSITANDIEPETISSNEIEDGSIQGRDIEIPLVLEGAIGGKRGAIVKAINTASTEEDDVFYFGGFFEASGPKGRGVRGLASHEGNVKNFGGSFEANGLRGKGVYGVAKGTGDDHGLNDELGDSGSPRMGGTSLHMANMPEESRGRLTEKRE